MASVEGTPEQQRKPETAADQKASRGPGQRARRRRPMVEFDEDTQLVVLGNDEEEDAEDADGVEEMEEIQQEVEEVQEVH